MTVTILEKRVYERPQSLFCPVKTFELYRSNLNPGVFCSWRRPKAKENFKETDKMWY